ncbi:vicilin-like seed storage protein At2g18540 [Zea mays]|uniref:Vicilin-like seed storage protein n=2 Tax=Zea mays TaxID=4577 RepID=K7W272_MAIZE|nr:vicilin-like seed storage protein At2g18540 [Zea mays]AQL09063.1 Vicilin-like seed storage protein [Zea mays]|eukprot:XP_008660447.1 vicilin-like seed storage protein At2g18540 [Zea mays]
MAVATTARWLLLLAVVSAAAASGKHERWRVGGQVVEKERRRVVAESEAGSVSAVDVADAAGTAYRLHFITMDPGALFLPVQLHADMVFYVHSGRGKVTSIEEESSEQSSLEVERGDVYNFEQGSILYIQSYPNASRQRLRIYAIFTSEGINADDPSKPKVEAYSSVSNLVKGFETDVLRLGFGVKPEVVEAIKSAKTPPPIIAYNPEEEKGDKKPGWTENIIDALLGVRDPEEFLNKKKKKKDKHKDKKSKSKAFNFYSGKPDVQNCYGWSRMMTSKDLDALHGSSIGMFMVNLTTGSMMGPHWNPKATEIAIVTEGSGIVQTVCPSSSSSSSSPSGGSSGDHHHGHKRRGGPGGRGDEGEGEGGRARWQCRNSVFRVKEGDVFVVPRFHPMAQMSFNDDSFVFVGFSTHMGQNHPQFLAGKGSVLQAIGKKVLALALGQRDPTAVDKLLSAQRESTILPCVSCAEELAEKAEEERKRREEEGGGKGKGPGEREKEKERREREEKEKEEEREREREEKERKEREREEKERKEREREEEERREEEEERARKEQEKQRRREKEEEERARRREEEEREREEEEERRREEEEGGGGRGDEPEREEEGGDKPPYRLSKKLKKRYHARAGVFSRSG